MSNYQTRTIREVAHVEDDWGWKVVGCIVPRRVVVLTLDGKEALDVEPDAARLLAAALMAAADDAEGKR